MKTLKKTLFMLGMSLLFGTVIALLLRVSFVRLIDRIENVSYDWRYRLKHQGGESDAQPPDYGIHIVDIDERSMEKMGTYWNWDRGYQAKMITALSTHFPAAIAFDVLFYDHEDERYRARFSRILSSAAKNDTTLRQRAREIDERLVSAIDYDKQLKDAIASSGRVTLGLALAEEKDYYDFASQVSRRMDMEWHNSLNPASAVTFPDSLSAQIRHKKTIIDGIYPDNARAALQIGHLNVVSNDEVVREIPLLYRFGSFDPIYLPMSIRVAATLFGTPNDEIVFKPERYIDIGKPFKIFKDEDGKLRFSYPDFTETQLRSILAANGRNKTIDGLGEGLKVNVSSYAAAVRCGDSVCLETRAGRFPAALTEAFFPAPLRLSAADWEIRDSGGGRHAEPTAEAEAKIAASVPLRLNDMEIDGEKEIGGGFTARRDSETEWEIFSDDESFWMSGLDLMTITNIKSSDLELADGVDRKLITFDFWIKREKGILVSSLPVLRGAALAELIDSGDAIDSIPSGGRRDFGKAVKIPLRNDNLYIVTYFGRGFKPFPYFSFYDIMENQVNYPMEGNIFIIGSSSPSLFDIKSAPHEKNFPAVEIHASILNSITTDTFVRRPALWQDFLILVAAGFTIAFIAFLTKPLWASLCAAGAVFVYVAAAFQIFDSSLIWIEAVRPVLAITLTFTAVMAYRYMTEEKDRKFLQSTFKQYLSPELIDMMYTQKRRPQLGGEEGVRTAYFTDIEGFSTFSEKLGSPTRLVELLNEYLSAMTDILLARYGTLDKYEGDAIIAFFGAPVPMEDHAAQACHTALDMQRKLGELREKWRGEGDKWPQIVHNMRMRIGINTGPITTGNMGSAVRMNYTMMGDAVNLAARLESAAKNYGVYSMISHYTHDLVKDGFETRLLDKITVVGKSEAVTVYELLSEKGKLASEAAGLIEIYNKGIDCYYNREWKKALEHFAKAADLEPNKLFAPEKPTPSARFVKMCETYIDNPPNEDWDGVNRLTSK
jgi:adenylate cyclase